MTKGSAERSRVSAEELLVKALDERCEDLPEDLRAGLVAALAQTARVTAFRTQFEHAARS